ncbi:hypothetical protein [Novosphingobium sp. M1R2S20]|uniref:Uncharacterized protein n=1 Tax=Novosphingobium rhizovicinum TaxID=3228928 RepID=A0ABV3R9K8_9SPHN
MRVAIIKAKRGSKTQTAVPLLLASTLLLTSPALAQNTGSVSEYRLPAPDQTAVPQPQGPIDPDNPWIVGSSKGEDRDAPAPTPSATPTIAPAPRVTPTPPAVTATQRPAARAADVSAPSVSATPRNAEAPDPSPTATVSPEPVPSESTPAASDVSVPEAANDNVTFSPEATPEDAKRELWLIVAAFALLAAVGAFVGIRRRAGATKRRAASNAPEDEQYDRLPQPSPPARTPKAGVSGQKAPPPTAPAAAPPPAAAAPSPDEPLALQLVFNPSTIRLSLVYATLQYELDVINDGTEALSPLEIRADLASAHASLSAREQLAPSPQHLEVKHTVPALASGEAIHLKGEVRVSLQQIRALTKGDARFFVPLVRFWFISSGGAAIRRVFTVGASDPNGSSALVPVRLDAGPRTLRELAAREIDAARGLALDLMEAHG